MKGTTAFFLSAITLFFLFSGCTIEKRRYLPGYHVEWISSKPDRRKTHVQKISTERSNGIQLTGARINDHPVIVDPMNAVADNLSSKAIQFTKESNDQSSVLSEECDLIILKSGEEIRAKVAEISKVEIKYKKCNDENGLTTTVSKSSVFMIKYVNGTNDIFSTETSSEKFNKQKEDKGLFGIFSLFMFVLSYLAIGVGGGAIFFYSFLLPLYLQLLELAKAGETKDLHSLHWFSYF